MHTYHEVKEMLHKELADIVKKGELSAGSLDTIDKLLNSIKNACKIVMYEEYSDDGYSNDGGIMYRGYTNARGRRYSRDDGYSYARNPRKYSYAGDKDERVEMLREMMADSNSDEERRMLQKIIRRVEQD